MRQDVLLIWALSSIKEHVENVVSMANKASFPNLSFESNMDETKPRLSFHFVFALVSINHLETKFAVESSFRQVIV